MSVSAIGSAMQLAGLKAMYGVSSGGLGLNARSSGQRGDGGIDVGRQVAVASNTRTENRLLGAVQQVRGEESNVATGKSLDIRA